jgi:hypothetical protein
MELKRPVSRPLFNPPPPPIKPKRVLSEEPAPDPNIINSLDDAISFFSKKIELDPQLLNILSTQRYNEAIHTLSHLDKLDLLSLLSKATSVAQLHTLNITHPPRDWTKCKYVRKH